MWNLEITSATCNFYLIQWPEREHRFYWGQSSRSFVWKNMVFSGQEQNCANMEGWWKADEKQLHFDGWRRVIRDSVLGKHNRDGWRGWPAGWLSGFCNETMFVLPFTLKYKE